MKTYCNKSYYSYLDSIIIRSKRRRMTRRYVEIVWDICKYGLICLIAYSSFYFIWSLLCYTFPDW